MYIMSFTRNYDDPFRVKNKLEEQTFLGRFMLNTPGNGNPPCFALDPYIVCQKWGANIWDNSIDLQSCLLGLSSNLNRDCINNNKNKKLLLKKNGLPLTSNININNYPICDTFLTTEQTRVTNPSWTSRDLEQNHKYFLLNNPQEHPHSLLPFANNISSRIIEKNKFVKV